MNNLAILARADAAGHVYAVDDEGHEGVWRTVNGRHVFIREGEDLGDTFKRSSKSSVVAFAGTREDALSKFQADGVPGPVLLSTSLASAMSAAKSSLLYHGSGRAAVIKVRVPVAEVLKVKPGGVWPGKGFSYVSDRGVPASWIVGITSADAMAFAEEHDAVWVYGEDGQRVAVPNEEVAA